MNTGSILEKCSLVKKWSISVNKKGKNNITSAIILGNIMHFGGQKQELEICYLVINDKYDRFSFAGPWHVQKTDISPALMTEHQHLMVETERLTEHEG